MRVRLCRSGWLFLLSLFLLAAVGCESTTNRSGTLGNGVRYWGAWTSEGEVRHLVILGELTDDERVDVRTGQPAGGLEPASRGLTSGAEGLWWNGDEIATADPLFILRPDGPEAVPISASEREQLGWEAIGRLHESPLWPRIQTLRSSD